MNGKIKKAIGAFLLLIAGLFGANQVVELGGGTSIRTNNLGGQVITSAATSTCASCNGVRVLDRNVDRLYAFICNDSTNIVYLAFATSTGTVIPLLNEGIRLNSAGVGGNCYEITHRNLFTGEIWATSTANASVITIIEDDQGR